jgi:hypothetical protein
MISTGFKQSSVDPCLFISDASDVLVVLYVDDVLIAATTKAIMDECISALSGK